LARHVANFLPTGEAPDGRTLGMIAANPGGYLERRHLDHKSRAGRETTMFAVHRLARISPPQAAAHWTRLEDYFDTDERGYVWGLIAYFGARRHDENALAWFERASDLSDRQLAWNARAALRAGDWPTVLDAIETMTAKESSDPSWRYWRARALKAMGRAEAADALLKPLAGEFNFYGQLAVEELGGGITAPATTFRPTSQDLHAVAVQPAIRRALELFRLGLRVEATREWSWAIRGFDDRKLLSAAEIARRHGVHDRAVSTADRTVNLHDFDLRYLAPYRDVLKAVARKFDLDEAWIYGLIRQESRFIVDARSAAGASGLMQLMPATARWVANKLGLRSWRWSHVTDIEVNMSLGTYYLRHVLDMLDGNPVLASAAYNAGPGRARNWRPEGTMEGAVYAESIPFNETRDYVKKVMSNATYYAWTFSEEVQSLRQRLGVIAPRDRNREISFNETP
jgi:soluble lytic murein transglycosylase